MRPHVWTPTERRRAAQRVTEHWRAYWIAKGDGGVGVGGVTPKGEVSSAPQRPAPRPLAPDIAQVRITMQELGFSQVDIDDELHRMEALST
jgi:hypothetical protein